MDILRHGEQVKVLSPAKLAQTVEQRLAAALDQYRPDGEGIHWPLIDDMRRTLQDIAARLTPEAGTATTRLDKRRTTTAKQLKPARKPASKRG